MPIEGPGMEGTGADGCRVSDFCLYCYHKGAFTQDVTMEEMIRLCVNYVNGNSRAMYVANMRAQLPHLKRWARKEDTQHEYHKSINRVLEYIQGNLDARIDLKTLAGIAHISPYHFHRIFKATIGESLAGYVQRLRMEYVVEQLKTSPLSLGELALRTGYSSEQALSRAFKKHFDLPPKAFKTLFFQEVFSDALVPRICRVSARAVITLRREATDQTRWPRLYTYAMANRLLTEATESLELIRDGRYSPALSTRTPVEADQLVDSLLLSEGLYAIFTHKGNPDRISELYDAVLHYWIPGSKYRMRAETPYVIYLNHPALVAEENLLTEIYVPVVDQR